MRMHLTPLAVALALAASAAPAAAHPHPGGHDGFNFTTNIDHDKPVLTCEDVKMTFSKEKRGDLVTIRRDRTVPVKIGPSSLRVIAARQGGVRVQAAAGPEATATVCMAAGADNAGEANALLDELEIVHANGELTVKGPERSDWAAYVLLSVPKEVALDLEAENGSLAMYGVSGTFTLRTTNGPITIAEVSGKMDVEAVNGPIHYKGHAGDVRLAAQNGPVGVKLDAATWSGRGLDASTQNGPISLTAPADLATGVEVEASPHSPFHWTSSGENGARWDGERTVHLGDGPVLVRLSTVNGPVNIKGPARAARARSAAKGVKI
jgi:hypothetical protein